MRYIFENEFNGTKATVFDEEFNGTKATVFDEEFNGTKATVHCQICGKECTKHFMRIDGVIYCPSCYYAYSTKDDEIDKY